MSCSMFLKVHIFDAQLHKFKENMVTYSEEWYYQDIMDFERRYQGSYKENMLVDYIWSLIREGNL